MAEHCAWCGEAIDFKTGESEFYLGEYFCDWDCAEAYIDNEDD